MRRILHAFFVMSGALSALTSPAVAMADQAGTAPVLVSPSASTEWERQKYEVALNLIHASSGRSLDPAYAVLEEIHRKNPSSPYLLAAAAELQYLEWANGGRIHADEIRSLCKRVLELNPDMPDPYVVLAKVEVGAGYAAQADKYADQALRLDPNKREAWYAKAKAQEALGNYDDAERWLIKALNAHTDPARKSNMQSTLGQLYENQKPRQVEKAVSAFRSAADLDPTHSWKRSTVAFILNKYTDLHDEAITAARQSLDIADHRQGREQLAIALYAKWAKAYLDGSLHRQGAKVPAPASIAQQTGYPIERMFVNAGWVKSGYVIASAMLKAKLVKDIDVLPPGEYRNALLVAAQANDLELTRLLIDRGANIHAADGRHNRTALFELATHGNLQAVELLLKKGARVNVVDKNGRPLTHALAKIDTPDCTAVLVRLLEAGADPDLPGADGTPLLVAAAQTHNAIVIKLLLKDYTMDANSSDSQGISALTWAAVSSGNNRASNVKLLLDAGANPWIKWGPVDVLQTLETNKAGNPPIFTEWREIGDLLREARTRIPKPPGFEDGRMSSR